jgi:predicted AAA+ superfamily ATPase
MIGAIFETAVLVALRSRLRLEPTRNPLYHWRSHQKEEVDAVIDNVLGAPCPIEIKLTARPSADDIKGIKAFWRHYPQTKNGILITTFNQCFWIADGVLHLPWQAL